MLAITLAILFPGFLIAFLTFHTHALRFDNTKITSQPKEQLIAM
jgi:hypothetical protein